MTQSDLDRCRRAIFSLSNLQLGEERLFTDGESDSATRSPAARARAPIALGRTKGTIYESESIEPVSASVFGDAFGFLSPETFSDKRRNLVTATIGEISAPAGAREFKSHGGLVSPGARFRPLSAGFSSVFFQVFPEQQPLELTEIEATLVPSPWQAAVDGSDLPEIRLTFGIRSASRQVVFEKMEVRSDQKRALIQLPRQNTDLKVEKTAVISRGADNVDFKEQPSLAGLIGNVEQSGSGFSRISPPMFVDLDVDVLAGNKTTGKTATYFASKIELAESLHFDYDGFDLVLKHVDPSDGSDQHDVLSVEWAASEEAEDGQQALDAHTAAEKLLPRLADLVRATRSSDRRAWKRPRAVDQEEDATDARDADAREEEDAVQDEVDATRDAEDVTVR